MKKQKTLTVSQELLAARLEEFRALKGTIAHYRKAVKDEKALARVTRQAAQNQRIAAKQAKLKAQESKRAEVILRAQARLEKLLAKSVPATPVGVKALKANRKPSKMNIVQL